MGQKTEIQYVSRFYVFGSEAPSAAPKQPPKSPAKKKHHRNLTEGIQKIYIDPVALCGVVAAVVMLCLLAVGALDLRATRTEYDRMKEQLSELRRENALLAHTYHTGYDAEEVRTQADKMGMVDSNEVDGFTVFLSVPQHPKQRTAWDDFKWFLSWLFSDSEDYVIAPWNNPQAVS